MLAFYGFLRLQQLKENVKQECKEIFRFLNDDDLSLFEKAEKLSVCCRLSPSTQKMSAGKNTAISQDTLDRIFTLALSLQANKEREKAADKIVSHRNCKSRIK
jgi:hypothetical protein